MPGLTMHTYTFDQSKYSIHCPSPIPKCSGQGIVISWQCPQYLRHTLCP